MREQIHPAINRMAAVSVASARVFDIHYLKAQCRFEGMWARTTVLAYRAGRYIPIPPRVFTCAATSAISTILAQPSNRSSYLLFQLEVSASSGHVVLRINIQEAP